MTVAISYFAGAGWQFFDNNGVPLAGGLIYTYAAGTTTPQATYTTSAGNTANANPIVLDSAGRVPNEVWMTSGLTYKFVLKTSADVQIGSYDNIPAANDIAYVFETLAASNGSSLVGFLQGGVSAVATTAQAKLREFVSVLDFGADPTGVADSSAAIQAAVEYSYTVGANISASSGTGSVKAVYFPAGKYKLNTSITYYGYNKFIGERAIIAPAAGVTAFTATAAYQNIFDNLIFIGGAKAIVIGTGNVDTSTFTIQNCEFQDQTISNVVVTKVSASILVRILNCKFYIYSSDVSFIALDVLTGSVYVRDCWATCTQTFLRNGDGTTSQGGYVVLDNLFGVPAVNTSGGCRWIENRAIVYAKNCRFGGESNAIIATQYAPYVSGDGTILSIQDSSVFSTGNYTVIFNHVPNIFRFVNNFGEINSWGKGFYFASPTSFTGVDQLRGTTYTWEVDLNTQSNFPAMVGDTTVQPKVLSLTSANANTSTLVVADKLQQYNCNGALPFDGGSATNVTVTSGTNVFGAATRNVTGTLTTVGNFTEYVTTAFNGLSNGQYMVVVNVEIPSGDPVGVYVYAGSNEAFFLLKIGKYTLCVPTYFDSTNDLQWAGYGVYPTNTQFANFGPLRVFKGTPQIDTENNILYGTAIPTTLRWEVGDKVINSTPTVGQPKSWVCTVAGTPGTWASEGNL